MTAIGPNVRRLIAHKMSVDAIPIGGGFAGGLKFLSSTRSLADGAKKAKEWVAMAILLMRQAAEPNPWKDADDEAIAGELLSQIAKRQSGHKE